MILLMKITVIWDMKPHKLVIRYCCFAGASCLHVQKSKKIVSCWENWLHYKQKNGLGDTCSKPIGREVLWGGQVMHGACQRQEKQNESVGGKRKGNDTGGKKPTNNKLKRLSLKLVNISPPTGSLPLLPNLLVSYITQELSQKLIRV
jgi:hypothetical protein